MSWKELWGAGAMASALMMLVTVSGCTNGVGGSCQTDTDCNKGLICVLGTDPTVGGTCIVRPGPPDFSTPPLMVRDLAVAPDLAANADDLGVDLGQ